MARWSMCSPNSEFRKRWDIAQMFLLLYVVALVPYRIGFSQDAKIGSFAFVFDVFVDLYFISDIVLGQGVIFMLRGHGEGVSYVCCINTGCWQCEPSAVHSTICVWAHPAYVVTI